MKRVVLLIVLLVAYAAVFGRRLAPVGPAPLDVVSPQAREIERALTNRRFADVLPLALELQTAHPAEPLTAYWLALAYRGLDRPADEAAAWERFVVLGSAPAEACPDMAEAYARLGSEEQALAAYARCADLDPRDPERLLDLGHALEQAGKPADALTVYRTAATLDPGHPVIARRIDRLAGATASR
jgi:Flp pilus assembly protein TadD